MSKQKKLAAGLYDRAAPTFDRVGPQTFARFGQRLVELADLAEGDVVLDLACGRGANLFPAAARVGPTGRVTGADLSPEMVRGTAAEIERRGIRNAEVVQMDAENLQYDDGSFDCVLCGYAIFWFPDLQRALAEIYRVLRPGGTLATSMHGGPDPRWQWYDELVKAYGETHVTYVRYGGNRVNGKPEQLEAAMRAAGFTSAHSTIEPFDAVYADADEWWAALWTHGTRAPLEQMPAEVLAQFKAEVLARLAQQREPDGFHRTWQSCFTLARK